MFLSAEMSRDNAHDGTEPLHPQLSHQHFTGDLPKIAEKLTRQKSVHLLQNPWFNQHLAGH